MYKTFSFKLSNLFEIKTGILTTDYLYVLFIEQVVYATCVYAAIKTY